MSLKRTMIYLSICLGLLAILSFSLWQKSHRESVSPSIDSGSTVESFSSNQSKFHQNNQPDTESLNDKPAALESMPAGRENPFARLPMEDLLDNQPKERESPSVIMVPAPPKPVIRPSEKPVGSVRGILYGASPAAYVETSNGSLQKVRIGDTWSGGKIISITKDSVIIRRDGETITQKLGE